MLDYINLETLYWIINTESFEKAGDRLCITQSAVTQRVRKLEENQGQILLKRTTPPTLTKRGEELVELYRKVKLLESDIDDLGHNRNIVLAVNEDSLNTWFQDVIDKYLSLGSGTLEILTADQDRTKELLDSGEVMGCISAYSGTVRGCFKHYLGEMEYRLVCTPGFYQQYFKKGVDVKSLNESPRVEFNRDDLLLKNWLKDKFNNEVLTAEPNYIPSYDLFRRLITSGKVYGFLDSYSCDRYKEVLTPIDETAIITVPIYLYIWSLESKELETIRRIITEFSPTKDNHVDYR